MKVILILFTMGLVTSCASKVLVIKDSCKEVYGGALLECTKAKK